jgi:thiol-disulfide isomerase/thioredoxin
MPIPSLNEISISSLNQLPITYIVFGIIAIICIIMSYFVWKNYLSNKINYNSNREHTKGQETPSKVANLMLFYVDWCPHCKTAKPEWDALKEEYEGKTINGYIVIFEEYNCTDESSEIEELINKYKIDGYPTIKLIKDNQVIEYDAKPTKATMEQFLTTVL